MTTISMNAHSFASYAAERSPRKSFAGHLAELQTRHEQAPHLSAVVGAALPPGAGCHPVRRAGLPVRLRLIAASSRSLEEPGHGKSFHALRTS